MLDCHDLHKKMKLVLLCVCLRFMENLQTEVLELEFHEFSKGAETINEVDFAKIMLRYTYLDTDK